jgi:hypothetical protein
MAEITLRWEGIFTICDTNVTSKLYIVCNVQHMKFRLLHLLCFFFTVLLLFWFVLSHKCYFLCAKC